MKTNEKERVMRITGKLKVQVYEKNPDGSKGKLIQEEEGENMVVTAGLNKVRNALGSTIAGPITKFKVGTGATAAALGNTDLGTPVDITTGVQTKALTSVSVATSGTVVAVLDLDDTEANGNTLAEMGLFFADNTLLSRRVLGSTIAKSSSNTVTATWTLTIANG